MENVRRRVVVLGVMLFVMGGMFLAGDLFGRSRGSRKEETVCKSRVIAVVNLDKGIRQEEELVNYAAILGATSNENFVFTGLEDARHGLEKNRYGAYVLLPYSFSEDVCSINTNLQRARLQYQINPRLQDNLQENVQRDVQAYLQEVNDNTAYMYVDAILEEFHKAQDNASQVIGNDTQDYQMVEDIAKDEMMVPVEYPELVAQDGEFGETDVEKNFETVNENLSDIQKEWEEGTQRAEDAFEKLGEKRKTAGKQEDNLLEYMATVSLGGSEGAQPVYAEGIKQVEKYAETYAEQNGHCRERMIDMLGEADPEDGEREVQPDAEDLGNLLFVLHDNLQEEQRQLQHIKELCLPQEGEQTQQSNQYQVRRYEKCEVDEKESETISGNSVDERKEKPEPETVEEVMPKPVSSVLQVSLEQTGDLQEKTQKNNLSEKSEKNGLTDTDFKEEQPTEEMEELQQQIEDYEKLLQDNERQLLKIQEKVDALREDMQQYNAIDGAELGDLIQKQIVEPIEKQVDSEETEMQKQMDELEKATTAYMDDLADYDPLSYVHEDVIGERKETMWKEVTKIQSGVDETTQKATEYVDETYENAEMNIEALQKQMDLAYQETEKNWDGTLQATLRAKEQWHTENLMLMEALTKKLLYSRKGSVANRQMYEFVINPIQTERIY